LGGAFGGGAGVFAGAALAKGIGGALGAGLGSIIPGLGTVVGGFVGGKVGDLIGGLFGRHKRSAEDASAAMARLAIASQKVTEAISNLPMGIKLARSRYEATTPATYPPGTAPPGAPPLVPGGDGKSELRAGLTIGTVIVQTADPDDFMKKLDRLVDNTVKRGGATPLTMAMARVAASRV
jgi:hypothetical protein